MRRIPIWLTLIVIFSYPSVEVSFEQLSLKEPESSISTNENPNARAEFEFNKIKNPVTGKIPENIRIRELTFSQSILTRSNWLSMRGNGLAEETWELAGPFNIGGRTRAVALDVLDDDIILAGGVSGGLWKSLNGGTSWGRKTNPDERNSITTLAQDTRTGKENIWYYGTGELVGNSPRGGGAPYRGDGIFKSIDSGESWSQLSSTNDSEPSVFGSQFQYIWRIITNEQRSDADELLVAAYGAILRSEDGGNSWEVELGEKLYDLAPETNLNESIAPFYTDVAKNGDGNFYAALSDATSSSDESYANSGFYWSQDGIEWYDISPSTLGSMELSRTVISAEEDRAYFFSNRRKTQPNETDVSYLFRFELDHINPDGSPDGSWIDLSGNLPDYDGLSNLDTQSGYNMMIKIDPNEVTNVFLGGTNLYRSTDGFTTQNNIAYIGGYEEGGEGALYDSHHPDQHDLIFYPNTPGKLLSANDGGLYLTQNGRNNGVTWVPLNNGYVTSQFYTVNIAKNEETDVILGGMQDNGSVVNYQNAENASWAKVLGGDGGYTSTVPLGLFWYFSFQEGQTYRLSFNQNLGLTAFARVDPKRVIRREEEKYLFINPFVLDPSNPNVMYLAGGNAIWRNNNLAQVPGGSQSTTSVNWDMIKSTEGTIGQISSLEITQSSKYLYYGTSHGELFRLEDPINSNGEIISSIKRNNLPENAYVSCIGTNPESDSEIVVVYSNYGIPSIFHSTDAGTSFVDIGGNLEEFTDGTGNGPSVRWVEIVPLENGIRYFVGTSTGLYSTDNLNGTSTTWLKESADQIGKSVVTMMDYRPLDGKFVVATHGNGVFRTSISGYKEIQPPTKPSDRFMVSNSYPNPFDDVVRIEFEIPRTEYLQIDIFDMYGSRVRNLFLGPQYPGNNSVSWDGKNQHGEYMKDGIYLYRIYYDGQVIGGKIALNR